MPLGDLLFQDNCSLEFVRVGVLVGDGEQFVFYLLDGSRCFITLSSKQSSCKPQLFLRKSDLICDSFLRL